MFPYVIKYKYGKENVVADALLWRYILLNTLASKLLDFEFIKELCASNGDFGNVFCSYSNGAVFDDFYVFYGIYLREIDCAFLIIHCVFYLLKKHIRVV